jgi:ferric-dicitrate binding protein FerR (iron transport regulator)
MNEENLHIDFDLLTRYLAGEATSEEQQSVIQWKNASAENLALFNELTELWKITGNTTAIQDIDIDKEWEIQKILNRPSEKKGKEKAKGKGKIINFALFLKYAASVAILAGISYFAYNYFSVKITETGMAETKEMELPDGTHITLNANSKLTYHSNFGRKLRTVNLEGEGFFRVTKNDQVPFVVKIGETEVKVIGTTFNIRSYGNNEKLEVTVSEGRVSVYEAGNEQKKVIVTKGERAVYNSSSKSVTKQLNDDKNFIAWKTRYIVFENDSLSDIVQTLGNVYHVEFVLLDKEPGRCTVTTKFDNKNLKTVLKVLQSTLDIEVEEKNGKIYIKGKGC